MPLSTKAAISGNWLLTRNCSLSVRGSVTAAAMPLKAGVSPCSAPMLGSREPSAVSQTSPPKKKRPATSAQAATRTR